MADWKYIMFDANGRKVPIIFPNALIHEDVHQAAGYAIRQHVIREKPNNWNSSVISAGFLSSMICTGTHGRSETMGIKSREEDREVINCWPYAHGGEVTMPGMEQMIFEAVRRGLER